jgi:hypothetical protein
VIAQVGLRQCSAISGYSRTKIAGHNMFSTLLT